MSSFSGGGIGGAPLSSQIPVSEATAPAAGTGGAAAREDHIHKRITSTTVQNTNASGAAAITFTRAFPTKPGVVCTAHDAGAQPLAFSITSFVQDGQNNYIGCTVQAYRSQTVPTNLVAVLLQGVFNIFGGAVGVTEFTCVAIMQSA